MVGRGTGCAMTGGLETGKKLDMGGSHAKRILKHCILLGGGMPKEIAVKEIESGRLVGKRGGQILGGEN